MALKGHLRPPFVVLKSEFLDQYLTDLGPVLTTFFFVNKRLGARRIHSPEERERERERERESLQYANNTLVTTTMIDLKINENHLMVAVVDGNVPC